MTYEQISALYSLFMTNVNRLTQRFGRAYLPNPNIAITAEDDIDGIYRHNGLIDTKTYEKYNGFLFPVILLELSPSEFRIMDGCHRYVYVDQHQGVFILGIPIKDDPPYELSIPLELCEDSYEVLYTFSMSGIKCAKVSIDSVIGFRKTHVLFSDLIYDAMKAQDFHFKASELVNRNIKIINESFDKGDMFVPRFQYIDEYGVIRHSSILPDNKSREYVNALYTMYSDNIFLLKNTDYVYMTSSNINSIEISNDEWWDGASNKESLKDSISDSGIYFPIVYSERPNGIYTITDGLHRFIACRDIIRSGKYIGKKYLLIPDKIVCTECEMDLYIPKLIYDTYSYLFKDKCKVVSNLTYMNTIESYIVSTADTGSIRFIRLLLERELNSMVEKNLFKLLNIKSSEYFNGGGMYETDSSRIGRQRFSGSAAQVC